MAPSSSSSSSAKKQQEGAPSSSSMALSPAGARINQSRYDSSQEEEDDSDDLEDLSLVPSTSPPHVACFNCASSNVKCEKGANDEICRRCSEYPKEFPRCNVHGRIPKLTEPDLYEKLITYIGLYHEAAAKTPFLQPSAESRSWGFKGRANPHWPTEIARLKRETCLPNDIDQEQPTIEDVFKAIDFEDWQLSIPGPSWGRIPPLVFGGNWLVRPEGEEERAVAGREAGSEAGSAAAGEEDDVAAPNLKVKNGKRSKRTKRADIWQTSSKKRFVDKSRDGDVIGVAKHPGPEPHHVTRWLAQGAAELPAVLAQFRDAAAWHQRAGYEVENPTQNADWWQGIIERCDRGEGSSRAGSGARESSSQHRADEGARSEDDVGDEGAS